MPIRRNAACDGSKPSSVMVRGWPWRFSALRRMLWQPLCRAFGSDAIRLSCRVRRRHGTDTSIGRQPECRSRRTSMIGRRAFRTGASTPRSQPSSMGMTHRRIVQAPRTRRTGHHQRQVSVAELKSQIPVHALNDGVVGRTSAFGTMGCGLFAGGLLFLYFRVRRCNRAAFSPSFALCFRKCVPCLQG